MTDGKCLLTGLSGGPNSSQEAAWDDRIAQDLSLTFHETRTEKDEELCEKGLCATNGEFDNIPKEKDERLMNLMMGSALKQCSKQLKRNTELPAIPRISWRASLSHIPTLTPNRGFARHTQPFRCFPVAS